MPGKEYQSQATINQFSFVGKAVEYDTLLKNTKDGKPALYVKGQLIIDDRVKLRFNRFIPKFKKDGSPRADYENFRSLAENVQTVSRVGKDAATTLEVVGSIRSFDRVTDSGQIFEGVTQEANFIRLNPSDADHATLNIEGYIAHISEEGKGRKVKIYALDYRGDIIPFTLHVPEGLANDLDQFYAEGQTATFFLGYKPLEDSEPVNTRGGIGIQRTTGKTRWDYVMEGASPALEPGEPGAIDPDTIRDALARRKARLEAMKDGGYQRPRAAAAASNSRPSYDDDLDF